MRWKPLNRAAFNARIRLVSMRSVIHAHLMMKQRWIQTLLSGLTLLLMQSCIVPFPRFTPRSNSTTGRVVDAETGKPIPKATVSGAVYRDLDYDDPASLALSRTVEAFRSVRPRTMTKPDGTFRLPRTYNFLLTKVFFAPCSGSLGDQTGAKIRQFLIQAEGYKKAVSGSAPGEVSDDVGTVKLTPDHASH